MLFLDHVCTYLQGPTHFLVIPKDRQGLSRLSKATEAHKALLGHLFYVAAHVARQEKLDEDGFRVVGEWAGGGPSGQRWWHILTL